MKTITAKYETGAIKISSKDLQALLPHADLSSGEVRGEVQTHGYWNQISSYEALAVSHGFEQGSPVYLYGLRTLSHAKESGYQL